MPEPGQAWFGLPLVLVGCGWRTRRRALLALMCTAARDPLVRCAVELVHRAGVGSELASHDFAEAVQAAFPDRFAPGVRAQWRSLEGFEAMLGNAEAGVHMKAASDVASNVEPVLYEVAFSHHVDEHR